MTGWDVVVAGAGHNALVATAYLARAGHRCLVLEARDTIGGDTATEELTLPGFRSDTCSTAHNLFQTSPTLRADELGLGSHGLTYLRPDPVVHVRFGDGGSLTMWRDLERTADEFARFSPRDAAAYRRLLADYDAVKAVFGAHRYTPIGWGPSLDERLAAVPGGTRWQRRRRMSAWDVIRSEFEDEHCRAFLGFLAFLTMQPPDHPGTGVLASSLAYGRQTQSWTLPRGGSSALPDALAAVVRGHGGRIRTASPVVRLVREGGRCTGVRTADGSVHRARRAVLSSIHVKHLVDMAPAETWDADFRDGVATWQAGVSMFVTHYAATAAPRFTDHDGSVLTPVAAAVVPSTDRLLRIGSQFARGAIETDDPVVLALAPSVADPTRAPEGRHTVKVIGFQPYELPEGPAAWDRHADAVAAANLAQLRAHGADFDDDAVLATVVHSPLDLERHNAHNWHGSCHGGSQAAAQAGGLRPAPGWAQHRTPLPGLYQTGSTTHPGGSVSGAPGRNAAMVLLRDLGTSIETVVGDRAPSAAPA